MHVIYKLIQHSYQCIITDNRDHNNHSLACVLCVSHRVEQGKSGGVLRSFTYNSKTNIFFSFSFCPLRDWYSREKIFISLFDTIFGNVQKLPLKKRLLGHQGYPTTGGKVWWAFRKMFIKYINDRILTFFRSQMKI